MYYMTISMIIVPPKMTFTDRLYSPLLSSPLLQCVLGVTIWMALYVAFYYMVPIEDNLDTSNVTSYEWSTPEDIQKYFNFCMCCQDDNRSSRICEKFWFGMLWLEIRQFEERGIREREKFICFLFVKYHQLKIKKK